MNKPSISDDTEGPLLVYGGKTIRRRGSLLNLSSMWHALGRPPDARPGDWLALTETKRFVEHVRTLVAPTDMMADIAGLSAIRHIDPDFLLVRTRGHNRGTWGHWQIALAYARSLDPAFHAWCNDVVRERLQPVGGRPAPGMVPMLHHLEYELARVHDRFDTVDRHAGDLLFLVTAAQELVLGNRRAFSERSQIILRKVVAMEPFSGRCPCCRTTPVIAPGGNPTVGSQCDHFFHRGLNRPELGWLVCKRCHWDLSHGGYLMRFSKLTDFRLFQAAVLAFKRAQYQTPEACPD